MRPKEVLVEFAAGSLKAEVDAPLSSFVRHLAQPMADADEAAEAIESDEDIVQIGHQVGGLPLREMKWPSQGLGDLPAQDQIDVTGLARKSRPRTGPRGRSSRQASSRESKPPVRSMLSDICFAISASGSLASNKSRYLGWIVDLRDRQFADLTAVCIERHHSFAAIFRTPGTSVSPK